MTDMSTRSYYIISYEYVGPNADQHLDEDCYEISTVADAVFVGD